MKFIGLLSDTHGFLDESIFDFFSDCDEVWHAGDFGNEVMDRLKSFKPVKGVYGNIDGKSIRSQLPSQLKFQCEQLKVYMTHIGGYPGHYENEVIKVFKAFRPDLFICGHSHILRIVKDSKFKFTYINPGAAGRVGFHLVRTVVRFKIDKTKLFGVEVVELGKRAG